MRFSSPHQKLATVANDGRLLSTIHLTRIHDFVYTAPMTPAYILLTLALNLLIAVQSPAVPPEMRVYATTVANQAIAAANAELGISASSTPVFSPNPTPTVLGAATAAPAAPEPAPAPTLSIARVDYGDPRWFNDENACYRVAIYIAGSEGTQVRMSVGTTTLQTQVIVNTGGVDGTIARFVYQPSTSTPQVIEFSSDNSTIEYVCQ